MTQMKTGSEKTSTRPADLIGSVDDPRRLRPRFGSSVGDAANFSGGCPLTGRNLRIRRPHRRHSNGNLIPFVPPSPEHKPPPKDRTLPTFWQCFTADASLKPTFVPSVPPTYPPQAQSQRLSINSTTNHEISTNCESQPPSRRGGRRSSGARTAGGSARKICQTQHGHADRIAPSMEFRNLTVAGNGIAEFRMSVPG